MIHFRLVRTLFGLRGVALSITKSDFRCGLNRTHWIPDTKVTILGRAGAYCEASPTIGPFIPIRRRAALLGGTCAYGDRRVEHR